MRLRKTTKKMVAYACSLTLVAASMSCYQAEVDAAAEVPEGYTLLTEEKWHPLGEDVSYLIGSDNDQPASIWNVYTGTDWAKVSAAVKDGADDQDTVSVFVATAATGEWGLQLGRVFTQTDDEEALVAGEFYQYVINYTIDENAASWTALAQADDNGQIKVMKDISSVAEGQTFTVTDTSVTAYEVPQEVKDLTTTKNLAYNKTATVSSYKEGSTDYSVLTDGVCDKWNDNYVGVTTPGYFEVDLGESYAASSIDKVVVWFRNGDANLYPANGYKIQFGDVTFKTVAEVKTYPEGGSTVQADGAQYMVATELNKETISGNVKKVRIQVDDSVNWGTQIVEIAVFAENPQEPVEMQKSDAPAAVTASSDDYNSITYTVTAGDEQVEKGYKYMVYAGDTVIGEEVEAGQSYTVNDIAAGSYVIKAVSVCDGMDASDAVEAEETVDVKDISELVTGTKNIASTKNNADAKVISVSSYYATEYSIDTAGVGIDGLIPSGEGADAAIRTGADVTAEIVIDLGNTYKPSDFEKAVLAYSNPRTYAANTTVSFSTDGEDYKTVAENTGYECKKDNTGTADLNIFDLDQISAYTADSVRYVKIALSGGANGWGYVVNEIGIVLNIDVDDAEVVTDKTPVDAPVIESKAYTGEVITADIEDTDEYTVTTNNGGTNVGNYDVVLTLNDPDNYYWSDDKKAKETTKTVTFEIVKGDRSAPEGIDKVDSTLEENADGKITNVTDAMEYRAADTEEYTAVTDTEIAGLTAGTYYVRYKETDNYNASEDTEVIIESGRKLNITLTAGTGYTLTGETDPVEYGTDYTFSLALLEGYAKDSKPVVKANDEVVEVSEDGTYTVKVTEDVVITVEGVVEDVVETEAPTNASVDQSTTTAATTTATPAATTTVAPATTTAAPASVTVKKVTIKKATKKKSAKKATITLKKVSGAAGYTVKVSTTKKFKKKTTVTVNSKKVKVTVKKLKANKTYYVKARAYKKVNGKKVYGKWSKVTKIKNK